MLMSEITAAEPAFRKHLFAIRKSVTDIRWYPYTSLDNVSILSGFLPPELDIVPHGGSVLDIGAADGDIGFLLHSLGCQVDFLDNAPTNFNDCEGLRRTSTLLTHRGSLIERDIDWGFELSQDYDLAIFLGILYHLRNPALALIRLAQHCRQALISTRVATARSDGQGIATARSPIRSSGERQTTIPRTIGSSRRLAWSACCAAAAGCEALSPRRTGWQRCRRTHVRALRARRQLRWTLTSTMISKRDGEPPLTTTLQPACTRLPEPERSNPHEHGACVLRLRR